MRKRIALPTGETELERFRTSSNSEKWRRVANFVDPRILGPRAKRHSNHLKRPYEYERRSCAIAAMIIRILVHGHEVPTRLRYIVLKRRELKTNKLDYKQAVSLIRKLAVIIRHDCLPRWSCDRFIACKKALTRPSSPVKAQIQFLDW